MSRLSRDSQRAVKAAKAICDGRNPVESFSEVLVTLDHTIALVLLATMDNDTRKALRMLNEGVLPSVKERLAFYNSNEPTT